MPTSNDDAILESLDAVSARMDKLVDALAARPSRREVTTARRLTVALCVLGFLLLMQLVDVAVDTCSPGSRAWSAIVHEPPIRSIQEARQVADDSTPRWFCDGLFPWSAHTDDDWPSDWAIIGFSWQATGAAVLVWWVRNGYRMPEGGSDASQVQAVLRSELERQSGELRPSPHPDARPGRGAP